MVGDVEADDGGDLLVIACDEAGAAVHGVSGDVGAGPAGEECCGDLPVVVNGPGQGVSVPFVDGTRPASSFSSASTP